MDEKEKLQKEIGQRLEEIIKKLGLKKGDIAKILGVDSSLISRILKGERTLNVWQLKKLYDELNIDLNYLITGKRLKSKFMPSSKCYFIGSALKFLEEKNNYNSKKMFALIPSLVKESEYLSIRDNKKEACEDLIYEIALVFGANPEWIEGLEAEKILFRKEFNALYVDDLTKKYEEVIKEIEEKTERNYSLKLSQGFISQDKLRIAIIAEYRAGTHIGGIAFVDEQPYNTEYWWGEVEKIKYLKDFFLKTAKDISFSIISEHDFDYFSYEHSKHSLSYVIKNITIIKALHNNIQWALEFEDKSFISEILEGKRKSKAVDLKVWEIMHKIK